MKPFLPAPAEHAALPAEQCIASGKLIDLTNKFAARWPAGLGRAAGQMDDPAVRPHDHRPDFAALARAGAGLESDKFDKAAMDAHFDAFIEALLRNIGARKNPGRGLTMLHFDSWEMSSQNWSGKFREEFSKRRGYDPVRFLPAMIGRIVDSPEVSERFLWDLRHTAQELVIENHVLRLRDWVGSTDSGSPWNRTI